MEDHEKGLVLYIIAGSNRKYVLRGIVNEFYRL